MQAPSSGVVLAPIKVPPLPFTLIQGGPLSNPTAVSPLWAVQPNDPTKAPFSAALGGGAFGIPPAWDYIFAIGYNLSGATHVAGEPTAQWSIEASYLPGGVGTTRFVEMYWQWVAEDGSSVRPISFGPVDVTGAGGLPALHLGAGCIIYNAHAAATPSAQFPGDAGAGNFIRFEADPGPGALATILTMTSAAGTKGEIRGQIVGAGTAAFDLQWGSPAGSWQMVSGISGPAVGIFMGASFVVGGGIATNATDGFLYIPNVGATPTGVPTTQNPFGLGAATPLVFDATHAVLYLYASGWRAWPAQDQPQHFTGTSFEVNPIILADNGINVGNGIGNSTVRAGTGQDLFLGFGGGTGITHLCSTGGTDSITVDTSVGTGASSHLGFFGTAAGAKPTVTGAKGGNAALGSLMTALSGLGLVIDSTTP